MEFGRTNPIFVGYRPQVHIEGGPCDWAMTIVETDPNPLLPGQSGTIGFVLVSWESLRSRLHPGMPFLIREGFRTQANATITQVAGE